MVTVLLVATAAFMRDQMQKVIIKAAGEKVIFSKPEIKIVKKKRKVCCCCFLRYVQHIWRAARFVGLYIVREAHLPDALPAMCAIIYCVPSKNSGSILIDLRS